MGTSDEIALASAVVSILALIVTLVFAVLGRRYTKEQIRQVASQIEQAKQQFISLNTPDVEVDVYFQGKPAEERGLWLKVTNHHPTITVNDLRVFAVGDAPSKKEAFTLMFLTFGDLKPMQSVRERSLQDLESTLKEYFPGYNSSGALISDTPMDGESFENFPLKVHVEYRPRLHGAQQVKRVQNRYFSVMRDTRA
jgi:hypothetical protein